VRIDDLEAYENVGPGLWFDWDNRDFAVTHSRCHGNRGLSEDWEGTGLFIEASPGPGLVEGNDLSGNTGGGIGIAESQRLRVVGNRMEANGWAVGLRAMEGRRGQTLDDITIRANLFRQWKEAAIRTSLGRWSVDKHIRFDENLYDGGAPFVRWGTRLLDTLEAVRRDLGQERQGREWRSSGDVGP
jgi:hypothetical protein